MFDAAYEVGDYKTAVDLAAILNKLYANIKPAIDAVLHVRELQDGLSMTQLYQIGHNGWSLNALYTHILNDLRSKQYAKVLDDAKEYDQLYQEITTLKPVILPSPAMTMPAFNFSSTPSLFPPSQSTQTLPMPAGQNPFANFTQSNPFTSAFPKTEDLFSGFSQSNQKPFTFSTQPVEGQPIQNAFFTPSSTNQTNPFTSNPTFSEWGGSQFTKKQ